MSETMAFMLSALAAESLLLLLVLLGFSFLRNRAARRRDRQAIKALVARVRQNKAAREQAIEKFLVEALRLSGEPLREAKATLLRAELGLLQRFAAIYKGREVDAAAAFDGDLAAALAPYHALNGGDAQVVQQHTEASADHAELDALRAENLRLSNELKINMETMSRMLNEYSAMFAGGQPGDVAPIAAAADGAEDAGAAGDVDPQAPEAGGHDDSQQPVSLEDGVVEALQPDGVEPAPPEAAAHDADQADTAPQRLSTAAGDASADESEEVATMVDDDDLFDPVAAGAETVPPDDAGAGGPSEESDDDDLFDLLAAAEAAPAAGDADSMVPSAEASRSDDDDLFDLVASVEEAAQADQDAAPADADATPLRSRSTG
jgi:hypothetical protein